MEDWAGTRHGGNTSSLGSVRGGVRGPNASDSRRHERRFAGTVVLSELPGPGRRGDRFPVCKVAAARAVCQGLYRDGHTAWWISLGAKKQRGHEWFPRDGQAVLYDHYYSNGWGNAITRALTNKVLLLVGLIVCLFIVHTAARSPTLYGASIIPKATLLSASRTTAAPPTSLALLPVVVFSHGLAAMRTTYTGICCDLASHGYVVASVEHR